MVSGMANTENFIGTQLNDFSFDEHSFICTQLNSFKYCFLMLVILFNINGFKFSK